jgi:peptide/nickel transport system substrate-binding protein
MKLPIFVSLSLLVLAACGNPDRAARGGDPADDVPEEQRRGGTVVVGTIGDIPDISPLTSSDHNSNQMQLFVLFTPLIGYDENFEPVPRLARSWEVAPDARSITFHLRDDVFWHDGVKTTAYDVKFSFDRAKDPATAFPNSAFWDHYGEATVVDSFTIRIEMEPHADFLDPWRAFAPAPAHILRDVPPAQLKQHAFATQRPLGNGPFRFVSRAPGQNWIFEANPDFPEELGGRPYLDRIVYRVIPEPTTLLTELLNGGIHYYIAPSPDQVPAIEGSPNTRLLAFDDRAFVLLAWNQRLPMFQDARVRRALTMAIDRQAVVDGIRAGYGALGNTTVPPFYWNHASEVGSDLAFDRDRARALLREAGWEDRNNDGILEDAQGRPFRFTLVTNQGNREREEIATVVQSQLRQVGVDAQPRIMEWGALLSRINDPVRRDYEALLIGWVTEFKIDDTNLFHCDRRNEPYQWVSHCNPRLDALLDTLPRVVDRDQALPLWREYQEILADDQPYTILYFTRRLEGVHNALRNVSVDARGDWVSVAEWFLHPDHRGRGGAAAAGTPAPAPTDTQR